MSTLLAIFMLIMVIALVGGLIVINMHSSFSGDARFGIGAVISVICMFLLIMVARLLQLVPAS